MKTTALFRPYSSGNGFLLTFTDIDKPSSDQFVLYLHGKNLTGLLAANFADLANKQIGFESRVSSAAKLRELELTIKEFCQFYRITYRTEPMKHGSPDDLAVDQAN